MKLPELLLRYVFGATLIHATVDVFPALQVKVCLPAILASGSAAAEEDGSPASDSALAGHPTTG